MKISIKSVKNDLKNIVLNKNYDSIIYRIIDNGCLDFFLTDIDDVSVTNPVTKESISAYEQVIKLLDRLVLVLKNDFISSLPHQEFIIEKIIESNQEKVSNYLKLKCCLNNSECNNMVLKNVYEITISNFCKNLEYVPELKNLIFKLGIDPDKNYNSNLMKIKKLLIDIINCNQKEYQAIYLFTDANYDITSELANKNCQINLKQVTKEITKNYQFRYSILLDNYYVKKKYLKIFD